MGNPEGRGNAASKGQIIPAGISVARWQTGLARYRGRDLGRPEQRRNRPRKSVTHWAVFSFQEPPCPCTPHPQTRNLAPCSHCRRRQTRIIRRLFTKTLSKPTTPSASQHPRWCKFQPLRLRARIIHWHSLRNAKTILQTATMLNCQIRCRILRLMFPSEAAIAPALPGPTPCRQKSSP